MRILGIDPGLTRCGVGIIDTLAARALRFVHVDVLRTSPTCAPPRRLLSIFEGLEEIVDAFAPQFVSVERVFAQENVRSVTGTSQAAGVAMIVAAKHNLPVGIHSPSEVKAAVTGDGRAQKAQVELMVRRILSLSKPIKPADASDALALAICQAWRGGGADAAMRAQYGGKGNLPDASSGSLTPAQAQWAKAVREANRHGAVAVKRNKS